MRDIEVYEGTAWEMEPRWNEAAGPIYCQECWQDSKRDGARISVRKAVERYTHQLLCDSCGKKLGERTEKD